MAKTIIPQFVIERKRIYAQAFADARYNKVATSLNDCSEVELLLGCQNCGHTKYVVYHCKHRVCPICSYWLSIERANFIEALLKNMKYPKMLTLTIPVRQEAPRETIKYLRKCFAKLRERNVFKAVKGGAYQIEVKMKKGHFHIHMHVILESPFIHYTQIYKAWEDITKTPGVQVDIRAATTVAQRRYIVKYSQKSAELKADGSDIVRYYEAIKGSRLFGTFGQWYNVKLEELLGDEYQEPKPPPCENCGAEGTMFIVRDGAFIFGKDWLTVKKGFVSTERPEMRRLEIFAAPPSIKEEIDDLIEEMCFTSVTML